MKPNPLRVPMAISLGAMAGACSRYYLTLYIGQESGQTFPWGTFLVNVTGAFGLGFFVALTAKKIFLAPELKLMVATGFFGSFTTFSTYQLDAERLMISTGSWEILGLYWLGSIICGVLGVELGSYCAQKLS